jgi:Transcriptional regulatory protein, C terminal
MWENPYASDWLTLQNPFSMISKQMLLAPVLSKDIDTTEAIIGRVSGRRTDITRIIMNEQSAIFLVGTPNIGKSTLIHYLQQHPNREWSWRDELVDLQGQLNLGDIHFVQIDLTLLEGVERSDDLLTLFIQQCIKALHDVYQPIQQAFPNQCDLKELRNLLRRISRENPGARYFFMLDSVERLGMSGMPSLPLDNSRAQTPQERGLALLDRCSAIRTLVELIDEFSVFGVILSIESLPRPKIDDQFHHVSLDLARFTTMTLQAFPWEDTIKFLSQEPENFGMSWAKMFKTMGGNSIFSRSEQEWLRQQTGTHPYLLHQFCLYTFRFKQEYASIHGRWPELQEREKSQLSESINESLSPFLAHVWQRLEDVINKCDQKTKNSFYEFISLLEHKQASDEVDLTVWYDFGSELRYILYSEGIVRYDRLQPIHFPGSILSRYLIQKANSVESKSPAPTIGRYLTISRPGEKSLVVSLSELEYRLLKTLVQHPERCKEEELMRGTWGTLIDRSRFTQRMHQLRRKLRDQGIGTDIIENSYGGFYSLKHLEWVSLV